MCGNGIRCVGKYVYDKGFTTKTNLEIETLAGIKKLELKVRQGKVEKVKVDMGEPILKYNQIPLAVEPNASGYVPLTEKGRNFNFTCVSMGNPHAITIVEKVEGFPLENYGPGLENNPVFPEKANIEWIEVINRNTIKMRVWERGSGETLACGTGACASVVACCLRALTERKVTVQLLGGDLEIEWDKTSNHVFMTGPAKMVFEGEWEGEERDDNNQ